MKKFRLIVTIVAVVITVLVCFRIYNVNFKPETELGNIIASITEEQNDNANVINYDTVSVVRIVDGDTLVVDNNGTEERVRLIGCDTPESVNPDESKNCEEGRQASEYTKSILSPRNIVYLEYDQEAKDKYGRTLAYVWLSEPNEANIVNNKEKYMLNAKLLSEGQASTLFIKPNTKYEKKFLEIENNAKKNNIGYWKDGKFDNH